MAPMSVAIAKTRHLIAATVLMVAHGALAQPNGKPQVFGPSGTMYDGNNAQLSLPASASGEAGEAGTAPADKGIPPTDATGLGARGASSGSAQTGGEH